MDLSISLFRVRSARYTQPGIQVLVDRHSDLPSCQLVRTKCHDGFPPSGHLAISPNPSLDTANLTHPINLKPRPPTRASLNHITKPFFIPRQGAAGAFKDFDCDDEYNASLMFIRSLLARLFSRVASRCRMPRSKLGY